MIASVMTARIKPSAGECRGGGGTLAARAPPRLYNNRILVLVAGAVLAPGKRTVTQVLRVMGLADEPTASGNPRPQMESPRNRSVSWNRCTS